MTNTSAFQDWEVTVRGLINGDLKVESFSLEELYELADLAAMVGGSFTDKVSIFELIQTHPKATEDDYFRLMVLRYDVIRRDGRIIDARDKLLSLEDELASCSVVAQIEYHQAVAQCHYALKHFIQAVVVQERLLELMKKSETLVRVQKQLHYWETMASLYLDAGEIGQPFNNCLQQYEVIMRSVAPDEPWCGRVLAALYFLKGRAEQRNFQFQAAANWFAQAYLVAPTDRERAVNALMHLCMVSRVNEHLSECLQFLRTNAVAMQPGDTRILDTEFKEVARQYLGINPE